MRSLGKLLRLFLDKLESKTVFQVRSGNQIKWMTPGEWLHEQKRYQTKFYGQGAPYEYGSNKFTIEATADLSVSRDAGKSGPGGAI